MTANLYESEQLQRVIGPAIRPGGLSLTRKAVMLCALKKGDKVLDAGCGPGATVEYLTYEHGLNAFGLDLSPLLLGQAREREPRLPLIRGTAGELPLGDSLFHAVFCECVLSLTPDPPAVLEEFYRVIRPGGFLILTDMYQRTPHIQRNKRAVSLNCCLNGAMEKDHIQSVIARKGFNIFLWEDHTPMLKVLAARMVFAHGSLEGSSFCPNKGMNTGYYFLAAKKVNRDCL